MIKLLHLGDHHLREDPVAGPSDREGPGGDAVGGRVHLGAGQPEQRPAREDRPEDRTEGERETS